MEGFLLRSTGIEPVGLSQRQRDALMLRMVPLLNAIITWWNLDLEELVKAIFFSKFPHMPI